MLFLLIFLPLHFYKFIFYQKWISFILTMANLSLVYLDDGSIFQHVYLVFICIYTDFVEPSPVDFRQPIQMAVSLEEGDCVRQQDPDWLRPLNLTSLHGKAQYASTSNYNTYSHCKFLRVLYQLSHYYISCFKIIWSPAIYPWQTFSKCSNEKRLLGFS